MNTQIIADVLSMKDTEVRKGLITALLPKAAAQAQQLRDGRLKSTSIPIRDLRAVLGCLDESEIHEATLDDTRKMARAIVNQMLASSDDALMQEIAKVVKKITPSERSSWRYGYYGRYPRMLEGICEKQWDKVAQAAQEFLRSGDPSSALVVDWLCALWLDSNYDKECSFPDEAVWRDCWRQLWCSSTSALPPHKAVSLGTYLRRDTGLGWLSGCKLSQAAGQNLAHEVGKGSDVIRAEKTIAFDAHGRRAVLAALEDEYASPLLGMVALVALPDRTLDQSTVNSAVTLVAENGWECSFSPLKNIPKSRWRKIRNALTEMHEDAHNRENLFSFALYHEEGCDCGSVAAKHLPDPWFGGYMWGPPYGQWLNNVDESVQREHLQSGDRARVQEVLLTLNETAQDSAAACCPGLAACLSRSGAWGIRSWVWQWLYRQLGDDQSAMVIALSLIGNEELTMQELVTTSRACVAEIPRES